MDRLKGYGLLAVALVACPCHVPLVLGLLGGTALGALLAAHLLPAGVLLGVVSVGALAVGLRALGATPGPPDDRDAPAPGRQACRW